MERRIRLKTDDVAAITQVQERAFASANGTTLEAKLVEIDGAEVFAVAAVLPLDFYWRLGLALKVDFTEQVAPVLTLDGALPRSEESSLVFRAEYSHFRSSLQRRMTV